MPQTLWKSEFPNVLALLPEKRYYYPSKGTTLQETAESLMSHNEFDISSAQILALVEQSRCSSYDCEFVALAQHLNIKLGTQDKKVLREFPSAAIPVIDFIGQ